MIELEDVYYFHSLNSIGGIESHFYYLARTYDRDITFAIYNGDPKQVKRLSKYARVLKLTENTRIKCKRLFMCFNREILKQCEAEHVYLVLHGDYLDMVERKQLSMSMLPIDDRIEKYFGVSQLVCDSWTKLTGYECTNLYEPIYLEEKEKPLMLVSATRLTEEKGHLRMRKLVEELDKTNTNFMWFIYTDSKTNRIEHRNVVYLPPRIDITDVIHGYDIFVQLSDNEGYCLAVVEALMRGIPVVTTPLPVLKELGVNKANSVTLDYDMVNIPIDRIKALKGLKIAYKPPKDKWSSVLTKAKRKKPSIKIAYATSKYRIDRTIDSELGRIPKEDEMMELTEDRYEMLKAKGYIRD